VGRLFIPTYQEHDARDGEVDILTSRSDGEDEERIPDGDFEEKVGVAGEGEEALGEEAALNIGIRSVLDLLAEVEIPLLLIGDGLHDDAKAHAAGGEKVNGS